MNPWRFLAPLACVCLFVLVTCATGVEKVVAIIRPAPRRVQHDGTAGPTPSHNTKRDKLEREVAERNSQLKAERRPAKAKEEAWERRKKRKMYGVQ